MRGGPRQARAAAASQRRGALPQRPAAPARPQQPTAPAAAVASPPGAALPPRRRGVVARGILDSYRKEKGLPLPSQQQQQAGSSTSTIARPTQQAAPGGGDDDDDAPCPVECVTEVFSQEQLDAAFDQAGDSAVVVVDFFKTACGACKFIYPGFVKLCKASATGGVERPPVVFLKHNVFDDEEGEVTDLCKKYNVRSVPKFIFFKGGRQLESFSTRDKQKVADAILKHAEPGTVEFGDWE